MPIDYENARDLLQAAFEAAENMLLIGGDGATLPESVSDPIDAVFSSNTQAYREALVGCLIARIQDKSINIRKPYVSQGEDAYNGRTLDERVVNPMLQEKRVPSSRGPFLSVFRRSVEFNLSTRDGVRDKSAYDAFLNVLKSIESTADDDKLGQVLNCVALQFLKLREEANVPLTRIQRMSLEQIADLVTQLLNAPSGGRFPVYIVVAAFHAIDRYFDCGWEIQLQGINVADSASGVGGDVVIISNDSILLAAEITERMVDRNRVVATFNSKIGPQGIEDYLFFVDSREQPSEAVQQVGQYFAQGHEINFIVIAGWVVSVLATVGRQGRSYFIDEILELLELPDTPVAVKVAWNESIDRIISG